MKWFRNLFCRHEWRFIRNVYGDEIIYSGYKRSIWRCYKCQKHTYKDELHKESA